MNTGYVGDFIAEDSQLRSGQSPAHVNSHSDHSGIFQGAMEYALSKFISFPSVSSDPVHREDCRQAAIWLKKCLVQLGAQSMLVAAYLLRTRSLCAELRTATNRPWVESSGARHFSRHGDQTHEAADSLLRVSAHSLLRTSRRSLTFASRHYDVIAAPDQDWDSDPFQLSGRSGYLYGRGASDNKGPIMAMAFAAAELLFHRSLEVDLVFLIEGEEECGSTGFSETVNRHKVSIFSTSCTLITSLNQVMRRIPLVG